MTTFAWKMAAVAAVLLLVIVPPTSLVRADSIPDEANFVIHVSIDGLMPHATRGLPNFKRLRDEGAWTHNARNDPLTAQTTPNHASQFTGLSVREHGYKDDANDDKDNISTKLQNIFDLVKGADGKTCMFVGKEKFKFFQSWTIDAYKVGESGRDTTQTLDVHMTGNAPCTYAFVHYKDPDLAGHKWDGEGRNYHQAVQAVDGYLGQILEMVEGRNRLRNKVAIIVTTDHGFAEQNHKDTTLLRNYKIPVFVWGPGVKAGGDLYRMNGDTRFDPGNSQPLSYARRQPVRCHDAGPMAADFLGIEPSRGRFRRQDLRVGDNRGQQSTVTQEEKSKQVETDSATSGLLNTSDQPSTVLSDGCVSIDGTCSINGDCCTNSCKKKEYVNGEKVDVKRPYCRVKPGGNG